MVVEVLPGFHFIRRDWLNGNHFVLTGPEPILIDTGYASHQEKTIELILEAGVNPAEVARIILTHTHSDHVGAVKAIHELSGCRVALHPISRHYIETANRWATWWHYYDHQAEFFPTHESIEEGQILKLGETEWEVYHLPGHASGQLCFFQPRERILLSADALWDGDVGAMTPRIEGLDCVFRALDSLARIAALEPRIVYPGHGDPIEDVEGAIAGARSRLERFLEEPKAQGRDQLKKIIVFTLLMKGGLPAGSLFSNLMESPWFGETISLFFGNERPRPVFDTVVEELIRRGAVSAEGAFLRAVTDDNSNLNPL